MAEDTAQLFQELLSIGLPVYSVGSDTGIKINGADDNNLVSTALAAHGQPLSSEECLALQSLLTEDQWSAYQDARKAPVKAARAERYKNECDPLYLKITEDAIKANTTPDYSEWLTLKDTIRSELPYESE